MDNVARYGFRPFIGRFAMIQSLVDVKTVATGYQAAPGGTNVDLNIGDPVKMANDGSVTLMAATEAGFGVIVGVRPYWDGTRLTPGNRLPGGTTWTLEERRSEVLVLPFTACLWEVDVDDAVTATTLAAYRALVHENADLSLNAVAATKRATPKLDISDHKTATAQFRIVGVSPTKENEDFSGANVKLIVSITETQEAPFVAAGV